MSLILNQTWITGPLGEPFSGAYIGGATNTTVQSSHTFTGQAIGNAGATRDVVVVLNFRGNGTAISLSSCTIGGVSATVDIAQASGGSPTGLDNTVIVRARIPTGTTADIAVTTSGNWSGLRIDVYRLAAASTGSPVTAGTGTVATSVTVNANVPANSFAIGGQIADGSLSGVDFTAGITEDAETALATNFVYASAGSATYVSSSSSQAFTATRAGTVSHTAFAVAIYTAA